MLKHHYRFVIGIILVAACLTSLAPACDNKTSPATPTPNITDIFEDIEPDQINPDNLKEYDRIFDNLEMQLRTQEAATFGGLYPSGASTVVYFTANGEKTIGKYVPDEYMIYVKLRISNFTLAELEQAQNDTLNALTKLGVEPQSHIDLLLQRVVVYVNASSLTRVNDSKLKGTLRLPYYVDIMDGSNKPAHEPWLK